MADDIVEKAILEALNEHAVVADTAALATKLGREHNEVVGSMKSLQAHEMVLVEVWPHSSATCTPRTSVQPP